MVSRSSDNKNDLTLFRRRTTRQDVDICTFINVAVSSTGLEYYRVCFVYKQGIETFISPLDGYCWPVEKMGGACWAK